MNILALDSSGAVASVAIYCDGRIRGEYSIDHKLTHSQTLMPMLEELVKMSGYALSETDIVAVAAGPGSFTGLRIGAAAAKGIAFALGCRMAAVPTLEGLSYQLYGYSGLICPIMDARRSQVYSGIYRFTDGRLDTVYAGEALALDEQLKRLKEFDEKVTFLGDGVDVHAEAVKEILKERCIFAPAHRRYQSAACVALRAADMIEEGYEPAVAEDVAPDYLRRSQAERERDERLASGNS